MKYSLVVTVFNEEKSIKLLLDSIKEQSLIPSETVVVDGGSKDRTVSLLNDFRKNNPHLSLKVFKKIGNRSKGRNYGVKKAKGDVILFTDAGCILEKSWVKEIVMPFKDRSVDVVAGYYKGKALNSFQEALIPYVLVMPDKVKKEEFLPATRSMAIRKKVFNSLGGFEEKYSHNEDYVFANRIRDLGYKIAFAKKAKSIWIPRSSFKSVFRMFYRFALGDIEASIVRNNVLLLFARYALAIYLLTLSYLYKSIFLIYTLVVLFLMYLAWSVYKNERYVSGLSSKFYLIIFQLVSDLAIMMGSLVGTLKVSFNSLMLFLKRNRLISLCLFIYFMLLISVINWGLPSASHPFMYHMDEWHQLNSVRGVATVGDPNVAGAAHGPMFQFYLSGVYLAPFILANIVNPFLITSPFSQFEIQQRLFEILRVNTLIFGSGCILILSVILRRFFKLHPISLVPIYVFAPIFISLSNYFKYDIALLFWILLGCFFMFLYKSSQHIRDFYFGSFVFGLAFATKISAVPLLGLIPISYFFLTNNKRGVKHVFFAITIFLLTFVVLGIPSIFFSGGDMREFFYSNLITSPSETSNIIFPSPFWEYMIFRQVPFLFGIGLSLLFAISFILGIALMIKGVLTRSWSKYSYIYFSFSVFFIFLFSLIPLRVAAGGNRLLVLLPGIILITASFTMCVLRSKYRSVWIVTLVVMSIIQVLQGNSWIEGKRDLDTRQTSTRWINVYINPSSKIGIENIPIYQYVPDIALKEFYISNEKMATKYNWQVVGANSKALPEYVIVTREDVAYAVKKSPKNALLSRLDKEGYIKIVEFNPSLPLFMQPFDFYIANIGPVFPEAQIAIFKRD